MSTEKGIPPISTPRHPIGDVDLQNRIVNYLLRQHIPGSKGIHADVHAGTVLVSGQLPSRHAKWLCFESCRRVAGVRKLVDQVVVDSEEPRDVSRLDSTDWHRLHIFTVRTSRPSIQRQEELSPNHKAGKRSIEALRTLPEDLHKVA